MSTSLKAKAGWLISGLLSLLVGCGGEQLDDQLTSYQTRLASVLDVSVTHTPVTLALRYPARRELQQPVTEQTISLFHFYQLQHCALATDVAERNTALGRTQLPSQRFVYEHNLISQLSTCITQLEQTKLSTQLSEILRTKQQQFASNWRNMLQLSNEIRLSLTANQGFIHSDEASTSQQSLHAWRNLLAMRKPDIQPIDANELETQLKHLGKHAILARLWRSQLLLSQQLPPLTNWLAEYTQQLNCQTRTPEKAKYLRNVFNLFFARQLQPLASELNQVHYQFAPVYQQILAHPDLSPAFKQLFYQHSQQQWQAYQQAMQEHIQWWQGFLTRCRLSPVGA